MSAETNGANARPTPSSPAETNPAQRRTRPTRNRPTAQRRAHQHGTGRRGARPAYRSRSQLRAGRIRLRRALGNLGMTLVVPGSVQLSQGNRKLGKIALRVWLGTLLAVLLLVLIGVINQGALISMVVFKPLAWTFAAVMVIVGLGWGILMMDAWRLSNPPSLPREHRLWFGVLSLSLALCLSGSGIASARVMNTQADVLGAIFAGGGDTKPKKGRFNILLLGGDAGTGREGLRPDTMMVASINAKTGETVLFGLPRNLEDVEFPADSPMKQLYPNKFSCANHACMLNAVYTKAMENKKLYPGVRNPGAQATKEAIEWTLGLEINYYALIDLNGFKTLIDAVGGITVDVNKPIPVGGGSTQVGRYIGPGKAMHLNGHDALWLARSRSGSSDYERMARQRCVINAMLNQLEPAVVITKFNEIASAGKQIVETDMPTTQMDVLGKLALKAKSQKITSVAFVPPMIAPGSPDFDLIRQTVDDYTAKGKRPTPTPKDPSQTRKQPDHDAVCRAV